MFRRSVLPFFGLILLFVSGLEFSVVQPSINDLMWKMFNLLDNNENGLLNSQEFDTVTQIILGGTMETEFKQRFTEADQNGDKKINQTEFKTIIISIAKGLIESVDSNKDQIISPDEYRMFYNATACETEEDIKDIDKDGDGKASSKELLKDGLRKINDALGKPSNRGRKFGPENLISDQKEPPTRSRNGFVKLMYLI